MGKTSVVNRDWRLYESGEEETQEVIYNQLIGNSGTGKIPKGYKLKKFSVKKGYVKVEKNVAKQCPDTAKQSNMTHNDPDWRKNWTDIDRAREGAKSQPDDPPEEKNQEPKKEDFSHLFSGIREYMEKREELMQDAYTQIRRNPTDKKSTADSINFNNLFLVLSVDFL